MTPCPLCDADLRFAVHLTDHARNGHHAARVACAECGLVQQHPQPDLAAYYASGQYRRENPAIVSEAGEITVARQRADMAQSVVRGTRILDFGAGPGYFAREMASRGFDVRAIEPDVTLDPGVPQHEGGSYDLATMFHSLEHLQYPILTLRSLPATRLIVEVPDARRPYGDLDTWFCQYGHLFDFSAATLRSTLQKGGWRVDDLWEGPGSARLLGVPGAVVLVAHCTRATEAIPAQPTGETGEYVRGIWDAYRMSRAEGGA